MLIKILTVSVWAFNLSYVGYKVRKKQQFKTFLKENYIASRTACSPKERILFDYFEGVCTRKSRLPQYNRFIEDFTLYAKYLPKLQSKPLLFLGFTGHDHVLGTYCVDDGMITCNETSSLIHEYGHFLDYNFKGLDENIESLSQSAPFLKIVERYHQSVAANYLNLGKEDHEYLMEAQEIFAQAFEYLIARSLNFKVIKEEYPFLISNVAQLPFKYDKELLKSVIEFFLLHFPDLRDVLLDENCKRVTKTKVLLMEEGEALCF